MRTIQLFVVSALALGLGGCWLDGTTPVGAPPPNDTSGGKIDDAVADKDASIAPDVAADTVAPTPDVGSDKKSDDFCEVGKSFYCPGVANAYCQVTLGQCTGKGFCKTKPETCPEMYGPVCGCDGKTYDNACFAQGAGVNVDKTGACAPGPGTCTVGENSGCPATAYCAGGVGTCGGTGGCAAKPEACDMMYAPVCGCDGKTYGNACSAANAGMNVAASGECAKPSDLKWYYTCGAPVCQGVQPTPQGMAKCTTEKEGAACGAAFATCDPQDGCARKLICTNADPTLGVGGCPKSRRSFKSDITYLQTKDAEMLSQELLQTKLATYRYTAAGPHAPRHLGFIIDDRPDSPAVDAQRDMVDLYGYLSMSVATLQVQQRQIQALQSEIEALRATCGQGAAMSQR